MTRYKDIYIERWNNGERQLKGEVTVFDFYRTEELMGVLPTLQVQLIYAQHAKIELSEYTDLTCVTVDLDEKDSNSDPLAEIKDDIIEQANTVSGDDDCYDYFPDMIYAFYQVCEQLNKQSDYDEIINILNTMENTIGDGPWETFQSEKNEKPILG